jgi:hypothetical protein
LVNTFGTKNWKKISECIGHRTAVQCLHRWTKILKPGLIKGPWRLDEDKKLIEWVKVEGPHKWSQCAELIPGRSGKQCRERWFNTLNPDVKKGNWTAEEDFKIFSLFSETGSKWSKIATHFPGRTENSVKNRFYSTLRRIASETKKSGQTSYAPSCVGESDIGTSMTANSLEKLLKHFPQAFEEKRQLFKDHKETPKEKETMKSPQPTKNFLGQKTSRSRAITSNKINNTFNINVNINTPTQTNSTCSNSVKYENLKMNSIGELGNMISNFSCENFLENFMTGEPVHKNLINNNVPSMYSKPKENEQTINLLLNQLNELESLLQNTKKQLFNFDNTKTRNISLVNPTMVDTVKGVHEDNSQIIENLFKFEV